MGSFYLGPNKFQPKCPACHAFVKRGSVFQFPSNTRVALIEKDGAINLKKIKAKGRLQIGKKQIKWVGSNFSRKNKGACVIYGSFDVVLYQHYKNTAKEIRNNLIIPGKNEVLLGCDFKNKNVLIKRKTNKPLIISDFLFIIKGERCFLEKINEKDIILGVTFENLKLKKENVVSLSFSLPPPYQKENLENAIREELIPVEGIYRPLEPNYRKSWLAVLETTKTWIFIFNDARPLIKCESGMTIFEFYNFICRKFKFIRGAICDSGQSIKLCLRFDWGLEVFGNQHYLKFGKPINVCDGIQGRKITSALIFYQ